MCWFQGHIEPAGGLAWLELGYEKGMNYPHSNLAFFMMKIRAQNQLETGTLEFSYGSTKLQQRAQKVYWFLYTTPLSSFWKWNWAPWKKILILSPGNTSRYSRGVQLSHCRTNVRQGLQTVRQTQENKALFNCEIFTKHDHFSISDISLSYFWNKLYLKASELHLVILSVDWS